MKADAYLEDVRREFRRLKAAAEAALAQVEDVGFQHVPRGGGNSLAVLVKHVAGNQRSRWTDFLTTDGEKPDRQRDTEFVLDPDDTRDSLMARWEAGWSLLFSTLDALGPEDLAATVHIRGEAHSVLQAIQRQLSHYAYHVGQIALLARTSVGPGWKTLSVPVGGSQRFNADPGDDLSSAGPDAGSNEGEPR